MDRYFCNKCGDYLDRSKLWECCNPEYQNKIKEETKSYYGFCCKNKHDPLYLNNEANPPNNCNYLLEYLLKHGKPSNNN